MLTIKTNNVPRPIIDSWELTEKERQEFDYLDWDKIKSGEDGAEFFRFKGQLYDVSQFTYCRALSAPFRNWDGYYSDSAFSGVLIRYCKEHDNEMLIVATYYS